jgi:putative oxidoreductase
MAVQTASTTRTSVGATPALASLAPYALTLLRVLLGVTLLMHGLPKFQNLQGFAGFVGSLGVPLPGVLAPIAALIEVVGGLLLIIGLGTRWVSVFVILQMLVTTLLVKSQVGFIASQSAPGVGAELDLLILAGAFVLLTMGPGPLSVDRNLLKRE